MAIKNDINFTYSNYLQKLHYANDVVDKEQIEQMLLPFKQAASLSILLPNAPILFAIDYTKQQYIFFSNALGHHKPQQVLEGGLAFTMPLMPEEYFKTYNEKVFPATLSFLKNIPQAQQPDYFTSFNYKIKNKYKRDSDIYQHCRYITSQETGLPTYCVGVAFDISHVEKNDTMSLTFKKINKETGRKTLIGKQYFYPCRGEDLFTSHEKIILQYLMDNLSSKMIADKLNLTCKIIENRRANMLRKTNTKNVAQLITYAFENNIK